MITIVLLIIVYLGVGARLGWLYYQDFKPKNKIPKKEKIELALNVIGLAIAWGPILLWIIIDDIRKGNHI